MSDVQPPDDLDFALAAYREDGRWQVDPVPAAATVDLEALLGFLRRLPGDGGALGLLSVDDDFFIVARVAGPHERLMLSDVTAADEWPLAMQVLERLGLPLPAEEDPQQPGGDLGLLADLGAGPMDLGAICDDTALYPDEMLAEVADRLGFGDAFRAAVDAAYA